MWAWRSRALSGNDISSGVIALEAALQRGLAFEHMPTTISSILELEYGGDY